MEDLGRTCTYSFGDNGVTATVSPSGRLLRISRHFRGEEFGYCVDYWAIPEPYHVVRRITSLLSSANNPDHNIGFYPDQESWVAAANNASADLINDRWPLVKICGETEICEIQYSISDGAVYQTFEFKNGRPSMIFQPSLLIRQLEFVDDENRINEAEKSDDEYDTCLLSGGKWIKRSHKLGGDDNKHVALFIYAYDDNGAITFEEITEMDDVASQGYSDLGELGEEEGEEEEGKEEGETDGEVEDATRIYYRISDDEKVSKPTKVTFVYFLSLEKDEIQSLPKDLKLTATTNFGKIDTSKDRKLTEDPQLNVALRRNLEYILSVCSIPVYPDAKDDEEFAIALTCGDIDSHRVATAASL